METEKMLRLVSTVLDRAWSNCASAQNRELLSKIGQAARAISEEIAGEREFLASQETRDVATKSDNDKGGIVTA